jgi:hypothetical protein
LQQLRQVNAPLSLLDELLAGARAKRDLEKERQKVQELETKLREKEYFDQYKPDSQGVRGPGGDRELVPENGEMQQAGTLRLELAELISAEQLQGILALCERIYSDALWLRRAEKASDEEPFPGSFSPTEDEELWINRLEIGTPNFLELLGQADALTSVATYLGALIGTPVALGKTADYFAHARKTWIEGTSKKKAMELHNKGKITETTLNQKQEPPPNFEQLVVAAASTIKPQPVKVTPAPKRSEDRVIREELKTIDRLDALKALRTYWSVRQKIQAKPDDRVLLALRNACDVLASALAPLTDQQVHELIERVTARAVAIRLMEQRSPTQRTST